MSPVQDDFEQLRRVLALKRHEQPPPGYFHGFSRQVIVRIKAGELGNESEASVWSFGGGAWFQRIWATLDAKPIFAGAFGVAVCGFFVVGALLSDATANPNAPTSTRFTGEMPDQAPRLVNTRIPSPWEEPNTDTEFSSIAAVGLLPTYQAPRTSLFEEIRAQQNRTSVHQVDFRVPTQP